MGWPSSWAQIRGQDDVGPSLSERRKRGARSLQESFFPTVHPCMVRARQTACLQADSFTCPAQEPPPFPCRRLGHVQLRHQLASTSAVSPPASTPPVRFSPGKSDPFRSCVPNVSPFERTFVRFNVSVGKEVDPDGDLHEPETFGDGSG